MKPIIGRYRHYKGGLYEVIATAKHSETLEDMVVYRSLTDPEKVWVRPAEMWSETVLVDGKPQLRFEPIAPVNACKIIYANRKTIRLLILPDGTLEIRVPQHTTQQQIDDCVRRHQKWIDKKRALVMVRGEQFEQADVDTLVQKAHEQIPKRVAYYARLMQVEPKSIRITQAKTRFGSCGAGNTLNFSCYLMLQEPAQIDYVVVHELAHIRYKNHGTSFYSFIARILPDWKQRERRLKDHGL